MCRSNEHGGRRCPAENDPQRREARNTRRRANYAAQKHGKNSSTLHTASFMDAGMVAKSAALGVHRVPATGVDAGKFLPEIIVGRIDSSALDVDSYKVFGFTAVNQDLHEWQDEGDHHNYPIGYGEVEGLTATEEMAVRHYTGSSHHWINKCAYHHDLLALYAPNRPAFLKTDAPAYQFDEPPANGSVAPLEKGGKVTEENMDVATLRDVTAALDKALEKGPRKQRIVYRGIRNVEVGMDANNWVKQNRSIGTEVTFDGYTSTTVSRHVASNFVGMGMTGAVYEILTPEGVMVDSLSSNGGEQEVLLPRNQRYIVVGHQKDANGLNIIQMVAVNSAGEVLDGTNSDHLTEPFVTDVDLERAKDSYPLAYWERHQEEFDMDFYYDTDMASRYPSIIDARKDSEFLKQCYAYTADLTIKDLEADGNHDDAERLKRLLKDHPGITAREALDMWEDVSSSKPRRFNPFKKRR